MPLSERQERLGEYYLAQALENPNNGIKKLYIDGKLVTAGGAGSVYSVNGKSGIVTLTGSDIRIAAPINVNVVQGRYSPGMVIPIGTDQETILRTMLSRLILPTIKVPHSFTSSLNLTHIIEVGTKLVGRLTTHANGGVIDSKNSAPDVSLTGVSTPVTYTGHGINTSGMISTNAIEGTMTYTGHITFGQGTAPYYDSDGVQQHNLDSQRGPFTEATSKSVRGLYPFLYGMNATDFTSNPSDSYQHLSKSLTSKGTKHFNIQGQNKYIYFLYPASYGDLAWIKDGNGFNVLTSFDKTTVAITSVGLDTNYTHDFIMYKTKAVTSVNSQQTYELKF